MGGWAKSDIICLLFAIVGIILWQITKDAAVAFYFAIAADFIGMIPALVKTYRFPHTEIWLFYLLDVFAAGFSLLAVRIWTVEQYTYPAYIIFANLLMVLFIIKPVKNSPTK